MSRPSAEPGVRRALAALARRAGVQPAYTDGLGRRRRASVDALTHVLTLLDVPIDRPSAAPRVLAALDRAAPPLAEPVLVARGAQRRSITLVVAAARLDRPARFVIETETGSGAGAGAGDMIEATVRGTARSRQRGGRFVAARFDLPALPLGVHRAHVQHDRRRAACMLIVAPTRCWAPAGTDRAWGVFAPAYALRSPADWGMGGVRELEALLARAADAGASWLGTLPLLAQFYDKPFEPAPYSPVSRRFWNEAMVDLDATARSARTAARLRRADLVDYAATWRLKWTRLRDLARRAFAGDAGAQRRRGIVRSDPDLHRYAQFRATTLARGATWPHWPAAARQGRLTTAHYEARDYDAFLYAQHLVRTQLAEIVARGADAGCRLYLDLPLGAHPGGFDTWAAPESFAHGAAMGAPPDALFAGGQDWSIPPLHPGHARQDGHAHFRDCVREHLRYAGALRVDHVMGLHRVYWIPGGTDATDGLYVRYPADELFAILALESHRAGARIIGEDLGTVPGAVRTAMRRSGVLGMSVALFDLGDGRRLPTPRADQLACLDTHDTPTLPGYLGREDVRLRRRLGLMTPPAAAAEDRRRARLRTALGRALDRAGLGGRDRGALVEGLTQHLGASAAPIVIVNLEDLLLEPLPQNVPGLRRGYPNWRRRLAPTVDGLMRHPRARRVCRDLARRRPRTN